MRVRDIMSISLDLNLVIDMLLDAKEEAEVKSKNPINNAIELINSILTDINELEVQ